MNESKSSLLPTSSSSSCGMSSSSSASSSIPNPTPKLPHTPPNPNHWIAECQRQRAIYEKQRSNLQSKIDQLTRLETIIQHSPSDVKETFTPNQLSTLLASENISLPISLSLSPPLPLHPPSRIKTPPTEELLARRSLVVTKPDGEIDVISTLQRWNILHPCKDDETPTLVNPDQWCRFCGARAASSFRNAPGINPPIKLCQACSSRVSRYINDPNVTNGLNLRHYLPTNWPNTKIEQPLQPDQTNELTYIEYVYRGTKRNHRHKRKRMSSIDNSSSSIDNSSSIKHSK
jgi:hypothetical protein